MGASGKSPGQEAADKLYAMMAQARAQAANPALEQLQVQTSAVHSPPVQNLLSQYRAGSLSLKDALANADRFPGVGSSNFLKAVSEDPVASNNMAKEQLLSDPTVSGLYGDNGLQRKMADVAGNLGQDRESLFGRDESYGLNSGDLQAYGQAQGEVERLFGNQEQQAAQSLSNRGLGAAPSGAAGALFSGIAGNKNEQLAKAQMQIAQNRVNTAKELAQSRVNADLGAGQLSTSLGALGQNALHGSKADSIAAQELGYNTLAGLSALNTGQTGLEHNLMQSAANNENSKNSDFLGNLLKGGIATGVGALTGGLGGALAGAILPKGNSMSSNKTSAGS